MSYSFTKGRGRQQVPIPTIPIAPILLHYGFDEYELKDYPHGWFKIRCAFHGETQASASYSTDKQAFNCHACEMSGDAIKIIRTQEPQLSFREAVEFGCKIAGISYEAGAAPQERQLKVQRVSGASVAKSLLGTGGSQPIRRKRGIQL